MRPNGSQKQLEKRRRRAIELLKQGLNLSEVAAKVGSSPSSVFLWRKQHEKDGEKGLESKPVPGRPPQLSKRQKLTLTRALLKGAKECGYGTDLWTTRRVAEVIGKKFGVDYHPNHMWRFLRYLGWSCQKPEKRAYERDEDKIKHWKRYKWPHIKKSRKTWCPPGLPR